MKLKEWILNSGLKKKSFADHMGISRWTLTRILSGKKPNACQIKVIEMMTRGKVTQKDFDG